MMVHRHVTHLLTAYIHEELPPHLRDRVSRHVQVCDECYVAMLHEREIDRVLGDQMPVIGRPRPEQLARLLPAILAEVEPAPSSRQPRGLPEFGLALALSLMLAVMIPALVSPRVSAEYELNQPVPQVIMATPTQNMTEAPVMVMASPTAVARLEVATEPAEQSPPPAPVAQMALE